MIFICSSLQTKRDTVARKVKVLFDDVDVKMRKSETNWLHRSAGWIHKAERKVAAKLKDDEAKKKAEKERNKRHAKSNQLSQEAASKANLLQQEENLG